MVEVSVIAEENKTKIREGIDFIMQKKYPLAGEIFENLYKVFTQENNLEGLSLCLSLTGFINYSEGKCDSENSLSLLEDGAYIAQHSDSTSAKLVNEFMKGNIHFSQGDCDVAIIHYKNAAKFAIDYDEYSLAEDINTRIKQIESGMDYSLPTQSDPLVSLVKISRSITALTDIDELLHVIAEETKNAMQADRCTVFLWDKESNELWSKVALGVDNKEIRFPADKGLAGYVVQTGNTLNIPDAYKDSRFNPEVDNKTGYRTKTILCMPIMNNNHEIIGAFQVLNKIDGVFTKNDEDLLIAIGGSASIALENAQLFDQQLQMYREQKLLFESFIQTLATSIDARDRITAGHSMRVKMYSSILADAINMDVKDKNLLEKAAILHDVGKIGIRDSVLQKDGKLTDEEYKHIQEHVRITHNILSKIYLSPDFRMITEMASSHHEKYNGTGYYRHLKGEEITLGGRILAVADVFDAITSKRHYRDKMPIKNVLNILTEEKGSHFDPALVETFMHIPLNKVIDVFLSETGDKILPQDEELLKNYNLQSIYDFTHSENLAVGDRYLLDLFNKYYLNIQNNEEEEEK